MEEAAVLLKALDVGPASPSDNSPSGWFSRVVLLL